MPGDGRGSGCSRRVARANIRIRVAGAENRARRAVDACRGDHGRRTRGLQIGCVFRVGEKGDVARAGRVDRRDARDLDPGVALELAAERRRQIAELHSAENITSEATPRIIEHVKFGSASLEQC